MGVLGEWWSSRVLLNCFTEASCKEASRQESEVMVDWREKGLLGVKAVIDSGGPWQKAAGIWDRQKAGAASESRRDPGDSGLEVTVTEAGQQRRPQLASRCRLRSTSHREKKSKTANIIRSEESSHRGGERHLRSLAWLFELLGTLPLDSLFLMIDPAWGILLWMGFSLFQPLAVGTVVRTTLEARNSPS